MMESPTSDKQYITRDIEVRNLLLFLIIAFGWSWFCWGLFIFDVLTMPIGAGTSELEAGSAGVIDWIFLLLSPFGPTFSAFIVTWKNKGKMGMRSLWKRFWNRDIGYKWFSMIIIIPILVFAPAYLLFGIIEGEFTELEWMSFAAPELIIVPIIMNIFHGGSSEEFGWRGYSLPRLQAKWNALVSSIILGIIWALWHIPLWYLPPNPRQISFIVWTGKIILLSILLTWISNNTNGNILAAVLTHAMFNAMSELFPSPHLYQYIVRIPVVLIIIFIFGYKTLIREQTQDQSHQHGQERK